jgi:hypothetical protein
MHLRCPSRGQAKIGTDRDFFSVSGADDLPRKTEGSYAALTISQKPKYDFDTKPHLKFHRTASIGPSARPWMN